jgi:hypothetical protein
VAETDTEARLEQKIKLLQSQINTLSVQLRKLQGQITHPSWKSYLKVTTKPNDLRVVIGKPVTTAMVFDGSGYVELTINGTEYKLAKAKP